MKKRNLLITFLLLTFILFVPMNVKATCSHNWVSDYYEGSGNGLTHKHYYYCSKCYDEKYVTENCTWKSENYYNQSGDGMTHESYYECEKCNAEKYVIENCTWELKGTYYENLNSSSHIQEQDYECQKCSASKAVKTTMKHVFGWKNYGSILYYECIDCGFTPSYNGSSLTDSHTLDHYSVKRGKTLVCTCNNYKKSLNPIVSVKSSKKKVCTVSKKGKKVLIKGKKKGSSTVTIKMKSGAVYTLKIKVK